MQRVPLKRQQKIVDDIVALFKDKVGRNARILLNTVPDETSGGVTSVIKYVTADYNRALFITWDKDPVNKVHYIFRLEITEKYSNSKPTIQLDKRYIDENPDGTYSIDECVKLFTNGII